MTLLILTSCGTSIVDNMCIETKPILYKYEQVPEYVAKQIDEFNSEWDRKCSETPLN
jgi:hypothetical protein